MIRTVLALVVILAAIAVGFTLWKLLAVDVRVAPLPDPNTIEESTPPDPAVQIPSTEEHATPESGAVGLEIEVLRGGKPVSGDVDLYIVTGTDRASAREGPFSERRLPVQPPGRYVIAAAASGEVGMSEAFTIAKDELHRVRVELRATAEVSGRVSASLRGVKDANVKVESGRFDVVDGSGASGPLAEELATLAVELVQDTTSVAEGRFDLRGVPSGDVKLVAEADAGLGEAEVHVKAPRTAGVEIALRSESSVHGTVRSWTGEPLAHGSFELRPSAGESISFTTDAEGAYRIESLPAGEYGVVHHTESSGYVVPHASLEIHAGQDAEFDFSAGIVRVEGQVTRDEKPMGGVQVVFFDDVERLTALTDVDGRYSLEAHRAGEYQVQLAGQEPFRTLVANDTHCTLDFTMK
ncbi:MAG: carboxypeptidase regulatory-like domain-containing protein [Planctomycetes bacterium]|nr:carboxypeptidase regulatory-like domain-containing protein [Planctomycetota bacterium]MBI3845560.1 carboxypeptidase regulatory-like domain-containing protein [Planctomycetota bacterium]